MHVWSSKLVLSEEALLVFEAQDPNAEQDMKAAATVQNAIQCCCVTYDEKKRATTQMSLDRFFKSVDRIESRKEPEPVPLMPAWVKRQFALHLLGFPGSSGSKEIWLQCRRPRFDPWVRKTP